ncbi:outer membrane protein assembly factor [Anaeroselena agilis]|uniref:BamA/TamA family outer membrane protein n=1 Tax=Anaeroselena agilis TaxID=3063788 RepID=A0ABU3P5I6_9FIRM|nr:BamA/TamA family outer membrane protein [Selenomonadales bacterium 4137-cl]
MKARRHFGHLLLSAVIALGIVLGSAAQSHAADLTGKRVTAVSVSGNSSVSEDAIMAVVKLKPGDTLSADKVQQDLRAIYELGNFFDVVSNFTEVPEGVKVVYTVMENPALKDIVVKGNSKVSTDKIKSMLTVNTGKVLNTKALNENARIIESYYHDQGYVLARVSDVAMTPGGVLTITINEGMLEGITVKGNEKTKTYVITREMKVKPGEAFNVKDARRSMQKVYNLGFFEDVNMKLNPGKQPNSVILETNVVEQKTGVFSVGGGYSQGDGLIGIIEVGDNNFRGTGDKVKVHWEFGGKADSGRNYEFSYTRPWLDSKQTSASVSLYNMTNEYSDYGYKGDDRAVRSTYDRKRRGWDLTLGRPQGEYTQNYITFKNRTDDYVKFVSGPVDYKAAAGATNYDADYNSQWLKDNFGLTRSITLARVFDSRDNVFNPSEGTRFSLSAEFAGKALGGDFSFNKYTAEDRNYFKVGHSQVVAVRLTAGYADGRMPDSGKFYVGGSDTLRGYNDEQFKGNKMLAATAEYRFPIVKKVEGVVFGDIGNAWDGEGYKLNDLKSSVGVGVRVTTPLGPIRLDYARGKEGGKTHFSFGGQF